MSNWYLKDGKSYIFNSKKFSHLNSIYGISLNERKSVDKNLKNQTDYLKSHFINFGEKFLSFYDISKSANIKPNQYFGEMFNKVSTLQKYAKELHYDTPLFLTITPPTYFKPLKQISIGKKRIKLVDNPNFCGVVNYVDDARRYLSEKWRKFLTQRIFKEMKLKYGERAIYMRTFEPMIDGTPHLHLVLFIPNEYKARFISLAKNYFNETKFDLKSDFDDNVGGVIAYILKYILKSFSNSKTNELDDVGYWYAFHKIRRFTTSRTLIPMKFYRLINSHKDYQDLLKVTHLYKKNYLEYQVSLNPLNYEHTDYNDIKNSQFKISEITVFIYDEYEPYFKVLYEKNENFTIYEVSKSHLNKPSKIVKHDIDVKIPVKMNNDYFIYSNERLIRIVPVPLHMKNYELYNYYKTLDPDSDDVDLKHFGLVQNECISRGLIQGELQSLNDFNTDIGLKV